MSRPSVSPDHCKLRRPIISGRIGVEFPEVELSMLSALFQPAHLLIISLIFILFFGGRIFANLGKGFESAVKNFRSGLKAPDEKKTK